MSLRYSIDQLLKQFEQEFVTHNQISVSKSSILNNFDTYAQETGKFVMPVLKSNAYGHGIEIIAKALSDRSMPYIAVDSYLEALRVRNVSDQPVLVMGAIDARNFSKMKYDDFAFVVQDAETVKALAETGEAIKVHLEYNSGMNRYGVRDTEIVGLARMINNSKHLELEGLMTHLAMSSTANQIDTDEPSASFSQVIEDLKTEGIKPKLIHVGQSSGSLRPSSEAANAIRLGIGLYGVNPFDIGTDLYKYATSILNPALKAQSTITHINILKAGDSVGYGYTYTAKKSERIGVIPFGYYDGLNRETLSNRGFVKIGDSYAPIVGRICMNHTMINLDNIQSEVGDTVTIYSNNKADRNSIDQLAREFKLFNYSMLTSLAADTRRILVD